MRVLFMGNNWVAWRIARWLHEQNTEIVGLVIHPPEKHRYGQAIIDAAHVPPERIFDGSKLREPDVANAIAELKADIGISILFDYILKPSFFNLFPEGVINLHPAFLPFNRGQYPNVWSMVDGTPAGVTLHYIDEGIDTGDIIARRKVAIKPIDTGKTLYTKLEVASVELFKDFWHLIETGDVIAVSQFGMLRAYHRTSDVEEIDHINLDQEYTAKKLIDIIRARTFAPYKGAYFIHNGRKVYMRLQLSYGDEE